MRLRCVAVTFFRGTARKIQSATQSTRLTGSQRRIALRFCSTLTNSFAISAPTPRHCGEQTVLETAICQETDVSSSDDQHATQTDLAVVIVPGKGDVTTCTFLLVPDFMVRRTLVRDTWCPTTCCFVIQMCSYVQVRPHRKPNDCLNQLVQLVKKFPEAFFMHTTAFFNAALRGAFAASAPAVAYARQLLHVRYDADRDSCELDGETALKWGLLDDVKTMPGPKKGGDSNIRFKCTLTDHVRHETPSHQTPRPRGDTWSTMCSEHPV